MPNGDPAVFGLPCRFPAAPSIRPESSAQDVDKKHFSVRGEPRKNFYPEFPVAAGKERGGVTLPSFVPSASSPLFTGVGEFA